jgi:hypothetical protein
VMITRGCPSRAGAEDISDITIQARAGVCAPCEQRPATL